MGTTDNLKNIIQRQKEALAELEKERQALESSDLARENAALKSELEKLRTDLLRAQSDADSFADENARLRNSLYEQIYSEKINILNNTTQKIEIFFGSSVAGELNRLSALEHNVMARINNLRTYMAQNGIAATDDLHYRLNELTYLLNSRIAEIRANAARMPSAFSPEEREEIEALRSEQLTDEEILAVTKKNNFERFIGLNVFNAIGVLLVIIGSIVLARFAYFQVEDLYKGILLFAYGGAVLFLGERLNRKKLSVFSIGITSGGIGILYAAMAAGYFNLQIFDIAWTALICVLITAGAFVFSMRYNSQFIAAFALIGGYLPILSIDFGTDILYGIMAYMIVLNVFALLISFRKKWRVMVFIGLFLNFYGVAKASLFSSSTGEATQVALVLILAVFAFLIYTCIPIISTYRNKEVFRTSDIVLLSFNTVFSCIVLFAMFDAHSLAEFNGLLAAILAAVYLIFGKMIEKKIGKSGQNVKALFYLTGLAFIILFVPLQLGEVWLTLGWLVEGVLFMVYGILKNEKKFRLAGIIISLLCLIAFLYEACLVLLPFDIFDATRDMFVYKYMAITAGSIIILCAYIYKKMVVHPGVKTFKYFVLANIVLFTFYMLTVKLQNALVETYNNQVLWQIEYLTGAAAIAAVYVYAYFFARNRLVSDTVTKIMSAILYMIGIAALFAINAVYTQAPVAVLIIISILSVFAVRELMKTAVTERVIGVEWYPLIVSLYTIILVTQILIAQFDFSFSSIAISIIYVLASLSWIIFGFLRRYSVIRKVGLGVTLFSVAKLFLLDLTDLTEGYRIVSYFILGGALIAISYVYQYFNKRLELKKTDEE